MKAILRTRGGGKTTELIRQCAEHGGYIVVMNRDMASWVVKRADELNLKISFPITLHEFLVHGFHGRNCSPLWFDNLDCMLSRMATERGATVGGWSASTEE